MFGHNYFGQRYYGQRYWGGVGAAVSAGRYYGRYFGGHYYGPRYWGTQSFPIEEAGRYYGKYFGGHWYGPRYWGTESFPIIEIPPEEEPFVRHTDGGIPPVPQRIRVDAKRRQKLKEDEIILVIIAAWLQTKARK